MELLALEVHLRIELLPALAQTVAFWRLRQPAVNLPACPNPRWNSTRAKRSSADRGA